MKPLSAVLPQADPTPNAPPQAAPPSSVCGNLRRIWPPGVVVLVFVAMSAMSWRRWTGMIVDIGRELDLPLRLLNGEVLYRDIHYMYGPLPPHFNALLYRVFGAHLDTLTASGLSISALVAFLSYRIARRLMPPAGAALATSLVVVLCLFRPAGNLVLPYSFGASHALVFSLTALLFSLRYVEHTSKRDLVIAGVFVGLAGISKQEFALASAVTVTLSIIYVRRSVFRTIVRDLTAAAIPALLVTVPVLTVLFRSVEWRILIEDCHIFLTHLTDSNIVFNRFRAGLDHPLHSLLQMFGAVALSSALVSSIGLTSDRQGRIRKQMVALLAVSAVTAGAVLFTEFDGWDGSPLRALPLFLLLVIGYTWGFRRPARAAEDTTGNAEAFACIVAVYSFTILLRVILRVPSGGFSGSALLPASLIMVAYGFLRALPVAIGRWTDDAGSATRAQRFAGSVLVLTILAMMVIFGIRYSSRYRYEIATARGRLLTEAGQGATIDRTLAFIENNTAEGEVIAVLPEGNDLAFLTGRRVNLRHQILIPDFMSVDDERDAIAALERDQVRFVFILNRSMSEFGRVAFGRDFYQTLGTWIESNYDLVEVLGERADSESQIGEGPFFVKIYQRHPS